MTTSQTSTVTCFGLAQTLAWASNYYLPAMLATAMARDLGISTALVFLGGFFGLAVLGRSEPLAGKTIDR